MESLEMNSEPKDRNNKLLCLDVKVWIVILLLIMISGFVALTIGIESLNCNSHDCSPQSFTQTLRQTGNWRNRLMHPGNGKEEAASRIPDSESDVPISFYAYVSDDFRIEKNSGHMFTYDVVITNNGLGYNTTTGVFTSPISGVFVFSWTVVASGIHLKGSSGSYGEISTHILHNGRIVGTLNADTEKKYDDAVSTGFVVLNLEKGDVVQIASAWKSQGAFHSNTAFGRWTFSGFQI